MHNAHDKKKMIWSSDTQRKNNDVNFKVTDDDATVTAWDSHIALTPLVWKLKSSAEFSAKLKINWKLVCQRAACFWSILGEKWKTFSRPRARNDWSVDLICTLRFKLKLHIGIGLRSFKTMIKIKSTCTDFQFHTQSFQSWVFNSADAKLMHLINTDKSIFSACQYEFSLAWLQTVCPNFAKKSSDILYISCHKCFHNYQGIQKSISQSIRLRLQAVWMSEGYMKIMWNLVYFLPQLCAQFSGPPKTDKMARVSIMSFNQSFNYECETLEITSSCNS